MSIVSEQIKGSFLKSGVLLDALDAIGNLRALLTLALTFAAFAIALVALGGVSAWLSTKSGALGGFMFLVSVLIWGGIMLIGTTAVGILLSDDVWQRERRTAVGALMTAVASAHRLAILLLLGGLVLLAYLVLLALVLLMCRIPGVGPLLYAVVLPLAALGSGLLLFSLCYLLLPLAAPCVWNGNGVAEVLATLREVVRHRSLYVVVMFLLLGLMVMVIAGIVGFVIFAGAGLTMPLSVGVVGLGGGFGAPGMFMDLAETGGEGSYGVAFGFGMTLLMLLGAIPSSLVGMKGAAIIHKCAVSGLAVDEVAADLKRQVDEVRRRAAEARDRTPAPKPVAARPAVCPNAECGAPVGPDDAFCVECGEKLK